jgi:serine/threonine-protein kinase
MGLVYRAYHLQLERTGAVKVLQAISPDRETTARFRHEAQAIAQLRHPNIVNVYDFGEYEGTPYMIVEYVPGGSLADRLTAGHIDRAEALEYLRGIAAGLDYAHETGVVHRDVKPANVLIAKDNTPVLADFGLAKLMQGSSIKSMTGATTGTPAYMAPEQVTGTDVGPAADRYSLATIAYEMFAGVIPFAGQGLMELLYAHVHRDPISPSTYNSSLNPHVDAVILRGLSKDPALRWETCTAFVDALAAALAEKSEPVAAGKLAMTSGATATLPLDRPVSAAGVAVPKRSDRANPSATVVLPWPVPAHPAAERANRRVIATSAAAILVVLLVMGAIWYAARPLVPTLSLSATTVTAGDTLVVTATHVPANQNGTIQLLSAAYNFPFRADASGNVSTDVTVPPEIGAGDHTIRICWASTCPAATTLHVVDPTALATPAPEPTPSPTPSAAQPTAAPKPVPPAPNPGPGPPPAPGPTPTPSPSITLVSVSASGNTTVTFHYFSGGAVSVFVCQNGTCRAAPGNPRTIAAGANTTVIFRTPTGTVPTTTATPWQAWVSAGGLASNSVNVGP